MSKKKGAKKNQDLDEDFEDKRSEESHDITSKGKGKNKKKGKTNANISDEELDTNKKNIASDNEEDLKHSTKKSQKKG